MKMNRRSAIRNAIACLAVALLPEVLRPSEPKVVESKDTYYALSWGEHPSLIERLVPVVDEYHMTMIKIQMMQRKGYSTYQLQNIANDLEDEMKQIINQ